MIKRTAVNACKSAIGIQNINLLCPVGTHLLMIQEFAVQDHIETTDENQLI